jgi:hypothetical protein
MRRILFCLLPAALCLSCEGLFYPPKVDCEHVTIAVAGSYQEPGQNRGCNISQDVIVTVSHTLRTSETDNGAFDAPTQAEALVKLKVGVVAEAGIFLADGDLNAFRDAISKTNDKLMSQLPQDKDVTTDGRGTLTYTIGTEIGMTLGGGSKFTGEYVAVTENYGPGNSCQVTFTYDLSCAQYVSTSQ